MSETWWFSFDEETYKDGGDSREAAVDAAKDDDPDAVGAFVARGSQKTPQDVFSDGIFQYLDEGALEEHNSEHEGFFEYNQRKLDKEADKELIDGLNAVWNAWAAKYNLTTWGIVFTANPEWVVFEK